MDSINKCYSTVNFPDLRKNGKNCRMLRESKYRHILMDPAVDLYIYI